jgi:anthranilate phosphoribosyltransferase
LDPADLGIARSAPGELRGGAPTLNAGVNERLLAGERGTVRDAVLLNAAAALAVHRGLGEDLVSDLRPAIVDAAHAVDSGAAGQLLARWVARSQELAAA